MPLVKKYSSNCEKNREDAKKTSSHSDWAAPLVRAENLYFYYIKESLLNISF